MRFKSLFRVAKVTVISVAFFTLTTQFTVNAHESEVFSERHDFMENLGKSMRAFSNYLKRGDGDPFELAAVAEEIAESASSIPELFPPNTGMVQHAESEAKPNIWVEWEDFVAAAEALGEHATVAQEAFESEDRGEIAKAVQALGQQGCGGCHKRFREKKDG